MDLTELRASARSKADEEATGFITDAELDRFINQGLRIVYGKIAQSFEDYFVIKGTSGNGGLISVLANTQEYNLPTDHLKLVRVERRNTNDSNENNWRKLQRLNIGNDQINDFYPVREGRDQGYGYFVAGNKIFLRPVPSGGFDMRLWYIPKVTTLVNTTDVPGIPEEYQELVAEYASIQCLRKSGEGIYKEAMDLFNIELGNLLDTISHRVQEPTQMMVSDEYDFDRWSE
jgi:hypothetical protein